MIIQISLGVIAVAFLALVIFLFPVLREARKTLKKTNIFLTEVQKNIGNVSEAGMGLIDDVDKLTLDIKKKSEHLNFLFRPFQAFKKEHSEEHHHHGKQNNAEKISDLFENLAKVILILNNIKDGVKEYVKSR